MPPKGSKKAPSGLPAETSKKLSKEANWAIKKPDAEPLLRMDVQHQVLTDIFSDRTFQFTAPVDSVSPPSDPVLLNFDQLYLEAVLSSMKTTQNLRSKLIENQQFALNFCKIGLLINVGRINTTLAFYPSMKTALRTYHPVPSIQTDEASRKDMQDAPRIKGILKACFLDWEVSDTPTVLKDVAKKSASPALTRGPPTTVVTAIFLMFAEAAWISEKYFPPGYDLFDIFYPSSMPSLPRAHAFLSLLHHILENKSFLNDFDTPTPPPIALLHPLALTREPPPIPENVDPDDELQYARDMKELRGGIVKTVPAYMKREEELTAREAKKFEKEQERDISSLPGTSVPVAPVSEPAAKRRRIGKGERSFARVTSDNWKKEHPPDLLPRGWEFDDFTNPVPSSKSSLPFAWRILKDQMLYNVDPDYSSDEDEAFSYDLLLRRKLLTFPDPSNPSTRVPVKDLKEFDEWLHRADLQGDDVVESNFGDDDAPGSDGDGDD
ncbi:hypothetical protein T439DRAFT_384196 [Meredithblackwellia eburnea MCA 4105]